LGGEIMVDNDLIKNIIQNYVKAKNTNYSILLNGNWGIGKTYFAKNSIKSFIDDDVNFIHISLFGLGDRLALENIISREILLFIIIPKKKGNLNLEKLRQ
jgi:hypothetical protein